MKFTQIEIEVLECLASGRTQIEQIEAARTYKSNFNIRDLQKIIRRFKEHFHAPTKFALQAKAQKCFDEKGRFTYEG